MHVAARYGTVAVVQLLLNKPGIAVNATNNQGWIALHEAARNGHGAVLTLLSNHPEINLRATTNEGKTVLHCLASSPGCDPDVLRNLLDNLEVDPDARDLEGTTAVMILLQKNFNNALTEWLRILVGSDRVDLELKNAEGLGLEDLAR